MGDHAAPLLSYIPLCYTTASGALRTLPSLALEHTVAMLHTHLAAVQWYQGATEGDHDDEDQGAGASALSLLSRRREQIPCDTGILREMG
jgi:hypothetical protein